MIGDYELKKNSISYFNYVLSVGCGRGFRVLYRKYCKVSGNVGFKVFLPTVVSCYF